MRGPGKGASTKRRSLQCQADLELEFLSFVTRAMGAGWTHTDVCSALVDLADNQILAHAALTNADAPLYRLIQSSRGNQATRH
jgi:hypothetical protein